MSLEISKQSSEKYQLEYKLKQGIQKLASYQSEFDKYRPIAAKALENFKAKEVRSQQIIAKLNDLPEFIHELQEQKGRLQSIWAASKTKLQSEMAGLETMLTEALVNQDAAGVSVDKAKSNVTATESSRLQIDNDVIVMGRGTSELKDKLVVLVNQANKQASATSKERARLEGELQEIAKKVADLEKTSVALDNAKEALDIKGKDVLRLEDLLKVLVSKVDELKIRVSQETALTTAERDARSQLGDEMKEQSRKVAVLVGESEKARQAVQKARDDLSAQEKLCAQLEAKLNDNERITVTLEQAISEKILSSRSKAAAAASEKTRLESDL